MLNGSEPIRIAVFGAGVMGSHHVRLVAENPGFELVAVVDPDLNRASTVAAESGARALTSVRSEVPIDAAIVAVPTPNHAETAQPLLAACVHVLLEKPIAVTPDQGRCLRDTADQG